MFPRSSHVRTFSAANFSESSRDLVIINRNRHAYYLHNTEGQPLILPRQMQEVSFSFLNLASGFFSIEDQIGFFFLLYFTPFVTLLSSFYQIYYLSGKATTVLLSLRSNWISNLAQHYHTTTDATWLNTICYQSYLNKVTNDRRKDFKSHLLWNNKSLWLLLDSLLMNL